MYNVFGFELDCLRTSDDKICFTRDSFVNSLHLSKKMTNKLFEDDDREIISVDDFDYLVENLRDLFYSQRTKSVLNRIEKNEICGYEFKKLFISNEKYAKERSFLERIKGLKELHNRDFVTMREWKEEAVSKGYHHGLYGRVFEIEESLLEDISDAVRVKNKKSVLFYSNFLSRVSKCVDFSRGGYYDEERDVLEPVVSFHRECNCIHTGSYDRELNEWNSCIILNWNEEVIIGRNIYRVAPEKYGDDKMKFEWIENIPNRNIY